MKKQGNISLLVLFILVACSLLGIIAVQYIKHMAIQTSQIQSYYKSYYLAKGGSEIGLSLTQLRGAGYSLKIAENDDFVKQNIPTGSKFSLNIEGSGPFLSNGYPDNQNCTTPFSIKENESLVLPLFIDEPTNKLSEHFSENKYYKNKSESLKNIHIVNNGLSNNIGIGVVVSSGGELLELGIFFKETTFNGDDFFDSLFTEIDKYFQGLENQEIKNRWRDHKFQNYLIIANKDNSELKFCLELPESLKLSLSKTYISSFGYANNKKTGLESIYQQPIPSYLIDSSMIGNK